jgi:uncharacterized protein YggE
VSESTYEVTVKDVIDKLKKELVQEEQGSTAYFGTEDVDRYLRQQLHGYRASITIPRTRY